jgi:diadenylate cyclase
LAKEIYMTTLFDIGFLSIGLFDLIDIVLFAIILYQVYTIIKGTIALNIFVGLVSIYLFWLLVKSLNMVLIGGVLDAVVGVGVIALIVVFQQEIRRFLIIIGKNSILNKSRSINNFLFGRFGKDKIKDETDITPIIGAVNTMARSRTGAIIVFLENSDEYHWANNGVELDSKISRRLIESIFAKTSPMHDGAMVISNNRIKSASCILPVSDQSELPSRVGLRHRAALGASENNDDAFAIIVSEETGNISCAYHGKLKTPIGIKELENRLKKIVN